MSTVYVSLNLKLIFVHVNYQIVRKILNIVRVTTSCLKRHKRLKIDNETIHKHGSEECHRQTHIQREYSSLLLGRLTKRWRLLIINWDDLNARRVEENKNLKRLSIILSLEDSTKLKSRVKSDENLNRILRLRSPATASNARNSKTCWMPLVIDQLREIKRY